MYCQHCGQKLEENIAYCANCGASINNELPPVRKDAPSPAFAFLGFLIPLVGFILYLVYDGKQPRRAKSAGKGALVGFIIRLVVLIVPVILFLIAMWLQYSQWA